MNRRLPPVPPHPDLLRRPTGAFGWLPADLLHDGWLAEIGPLAAAIFLMLALAADRRGASFYSRDRMAVALGMTRHDVDHGLQQLVDLALVAHRPWRQGVRDGVWQILPLPPRRLAQRSQTVLSAAELLRSLGFTPPAATQAP